MLLLPVMLFLVATFTVLIPRKIGQIIDTMVQHGAHPDWSLIWRWSSQWSSDLFSARGMAFAIIRCLVSTGGAITSAPISTLERQRPRIFFSNKRTGDLMALARNDADAIELAAGEAALAGFDGFMTFVLVISMMTLGVDWRLGPLKSVTFPFMAWSFKWITPENSRRLQRLA